MSAKIKKPQKIFVTVIISVVLFFILAYGLFEISKSRTFQFFGEVISSVDTQEKVVALTFDDGPTEFTPEVLDILKEKKIHASFYIMGSQLNKHLDIGKNMVVQGHELGNHTYSHTRMWLSKLSFVAEELESTDKLIRDAGYTGEIFFRAPYGKKLFTLPWYLAQHNIKSVTWDIEPDTYGTSADFIVPYTLERVKPGSIILLHPHCKECTGQRESIGKIVDALTVQGYKFVTVSELLKYR